MASYTSTTQYGPPTTGMFSLGDLLTDASGAIFQCVQTGSPGGWVAAPGGIEQASTATAVGAVATVTGLTCAIERTGSVFKLTFTLAAVPIVCTDAAASGSSGSVKIFDFVQSGISVLGCRQDYTAVTNASAMSTAAGDIVQVLGLGTVAADAGDGALTSTEVDIGSVTGSLTASSHIAAGTKYSGALGAIDGSATAADIYLNWSGSATTTDASGTTTVTGTITLVGVLLGDD